MGGNQSNDWNLHDHRSDEETDNIGRFFQRDDPCSLSKLIERDDSEEVENYLRGTDELSEYTVSCFFIQAVLQGSLNVVKIFLQHGANVDTPDVMFGESPLMMAARMGNVEMMDVLLTHGANINYKSSTELGEGDTAFHVAASNNRGDCLVHLLQIDSSWMDVQNKLGLTPVMVAAMRGQTEAVKILVDKGCDISIKNNAGDNVMHIIIKSFSSVLAYDRFTVTECLDLLIRRGIDVNGIGQDGYPPIHLCVACNNIYALRRFVKANCDLNSGSETPLELALRQTNVIAAKVLVESGCDTHNPKLCNNALDNMLKVSNISLPHRLMFLCKCSVRKCLGLFPEQRVSSLLIPESLKTYIVSFR